MAEDCIFCKIVSGEMKTDFVYEDDNFVAFLDINPVVEGHTLVIPKKHFKTLLDIPNTLGNEMLEAVKKVSLDLIKNKKGDGINVFTNIHESAGQIVHHAHLHIIPRSKGDGVRIAVNLKKINELKEE